MIMKNDRKERSTNDLKKPSGVVPTKLKRQASYAGLVGDTAPNQSIIEPECENPYCQVCQGIGDKEKHHVLCNCEKCLQERAKLPDAGHCQCDECRKERIRGAVKHSTVLVCFESGHYKKLHGKWKGDTIWTHWIKPDGKTVHINKDKVEYYEEL